MQNPVAIPKPRFTPSFLRVLALGILFLCGIGWWLLPHLLEEIYEGTAGPLLNTLISGRDVHPLEYYAGQLHLVLMLGTQIALLLAMLAVVWSFESGRIGIIRGARILQKLAPILLVAVAGSWLLFRILGSLHLPFFGDAAEKVVAAWLLATGGHLYGDVYANHGPFSYLIAHVVYVLTGSTELAPYRLAQWALVVMTVAAVGASSALSGWRQRLSAMAILACVIATCFPAWKAHEPLYSAEAGLLFSIFLSLWVLPLLLDLPTPPAATGTAAAMLPCIAAAGYPFAVPVVLVLAGTAALLHARGQLNIRLSEAAKPALIGVTVTTTMLLFWFAVFADLTGYLAYHLYLNQVYYARITGFDPDQALGQLRRLTEPGFAWALLAILLLPLWIWRQAKLLWITRRGIFAAAGMLLLIIGMLYLNARDAAGFKVASMQVPVVALIAIILTRAAEPAPARAAEQPARARLVVILMVMTFVIEIVALTPFPGELSEDFLKRRRLAAQAERMPLTSTKSSAF